MSGYPSEAALAALERPTAHPHDPSAAGGVEWIQTHLSHVILTSRRVYKLRKPVDLGFVDFSARAERNADCLREVALNRRLAPDVYLGVAPLLGEGDSIRIGPPAEALAGDDVEHCVVMRRLPAGRDALSLLEAGRLGPDLVDRLAGVVARFHAGHGLGIPAPFDREAWLERCTGPAEANFRLLGEASEDLVPREALGRVAEPARRFVADHAGRFEARRVAGRAVDAHGDLHLQHVWFEGDAAEPIAIDGLEFDEGLRHIDAAAEVAFPAMDLAYRGREDLAERFLRIYARERPDFDLYGVVDYFASYRAAVRAKVAALAAADPGIGGEQRAGAAGSARRHLALAERLLAPRPPATLVLVGGVVGTGKTSVAEALADAGPGVSLASDRLRKQLAGLAPDERPADPAALYAAGARERVYAALLEAARPVLRSGRIAILDATWSRRAWRERARALASEVGASTLFVEARCSEPVVRERLAQRARAGSDASDAGPERYAASVAEFEPLDATEGAQRRVRTDDPDWPKRCAEIAALLGAAGRLGRGAPPLDEPIGG